MPKNKKKPRKQDDSLKSRKRAKKGRSKTTRGEVYYNNDLLISSWKARDELYETLFGQPVSISPPDYAPPKLLKSKDDAAAREAEFQLENTSGQLDVSNQQLAVFTYAPDPIRPYWTYITAGLSTPWLQDEAQEVSGFGLELVIKSPIEADWPAQILRTMAYYIFNHMGTLSPTVRLALNSSVVAGGDSLLRNMLIWYADEAPDSWYQLPSGGFGIFTAIGITDDEMKLTESLHEEYGTWCMQQILRQIGLGQITDPSRSSVMDRDDISSVINSVQGFAEQFHQDFPNANRLNSCGIEEQN